VRRAAGAAAVALALAAAGCGGDTDATPTGAVRLFAAASRRHDVDGMRAVVATPERLGRALACDGPGRGALGALASAREHMAERADMIAELRGVDDLGGRTVAPGDTYRGCKVTAPLELRHVRVRYVETGQAAPRAETGDVVHLDGHWRLVVP
jgi:hypothetical protein